METSYWFLGLYCIFLFKVDNANSRRCFTEAQKEKKEKKKQKQKQKERKKIECRVEKKKMEADSNKNGEVAKVKVRFVSIGNSCGIFRCSRP